MLTASLDWTVKLWNVAEVQQGQTKPLYEFVSSSYDYVCDVRWCPIHPAVFCTVTSCGTVCVWNLCKSTIEALETIRLTGDEKQAILTGGMNSASSYMNTNGGALTRTTWSANGRFILAGDSRGVVHLITVHDNVISFSTSDENKFEMLVLGSSVGKTQTSI